jgi:hypothetical protein
VQKRDHEESTFIWEANGRERTKATAGGTPGNSVVGFLSDSEAAKLTKERLKRHRQLSTFFTFLVASTSD